MPSEKADEAGKTTSHVYMWKEIDPREGIAMCKCRELGVCPVNSWKSWEASVPDELGQEEAGA